MKTIYTAMGCLLLLLICTSSLSVSQIDCYVLGVGDSGADLCIGYTKQDGIVTQQTSYVSCDAATCEVLRSKLETGEAVSLEITSSLFWKKARLCTNTNAK